MGYIKRIIDNELKSLENYNIMISVSGVKGCGKTETATRFAKTVFTVNETLNQRNLLELNPELILAGEKPHLIDEWQIQPWIWDLVRHAVDNKAGCFILTGSATPNQNSYTHSGAGCMVRFHMRPLSWYEMGYSTGEISLSDIINNEIKTTSMIEIPFLEKLKMLTFGGWPFLLNIKDDKIKSKILDEYVRTIYTEDLKRADSKNINWKIGRNLLISLARNVGTYASVKSILDDMKIVNETISRPTFESYYSVLQKIYVIEELEAWPTHLRSTIMLRSSPKRYFVDPSLAVSLLKGTPEKLMNDLNFTGFIFENEVIKNLRIYAQEIGAELYYYGDSYSTLINGVNVVKNREVDVIMALDDGNWCAFEIKLGFTVKAIDDAVASLNNLMNNLDFKKVKKPLSLNIITCDGFAYKRKEDGINVIPLNTLK